MISNAYILHYNHNIIMITFQSHIHINIYLITDIITYIYYIRLFWFVLPLFLCYRLHFTYIPFNAQKKKKTKKNSIVGMKNNIDIWYHKYHFNAFPLVIIAYVQQLMKIFVHSWHIMTFNGLLYFIYGFYTDIGNKNFNHCFHPDHKRLWQFKAHNGVFQTKTQPKHLKHSGKVSYYSKSSMIYNLYN